MHSHVREKIGNAGVSVLEIVIAFGLLMLIFMPTIELLYSFNMSRLREALDFRYEGASLSSSNMSWTPDGSEAVIVGRGGSWKPVPVDSFQSQGASCLGLSTDMLETYSEGSPGRVPKVYEYSAGDLGFSSTTLATGAGIIGKKIYVSANSSSTTEPDLFEFGMDDPDPSSQASMPRLSKIAEKDTGPGLNSLTVRGQEIFSGNTSVNGQIQEFDARTLETLSTLKIPGSNSTTSPLTKTVRIYRDIVIVGTEKSVLPEISMFRLKDGALIGQIETNYGVNDMLALGTSLLVASPKDPEIDVFDISPAFDAGYGNGHAPIPLPPSSFSKVSEYDAPGGSGNGKTFAVNGDSLYLGRTKGGDEVLKLGMSYRQSGDSDGSSYPNDESVYFSSTSLSASHSGISLSELLHAKIGWSVDAVLSRSPYLLVFSADAYKELQIFKEDRSVFGGNAATLLAAVDLPGRISSVACRGGVLYATTQQNSVPLIIIKL